MTDETPALPAAVPVPQEDGPPDISGTEGDDVLGGTDAAERIEALAGDDLILASAGADTVCGGEGRDTLSIALQRAEITPSLAADATVTIARAGAAPLTLRGVERAVVEDGAYLYGLDGEDALLVYQLYAAGLGRTPEEAGFRFWVSERAAGLSDKALAQAFLASSEIAGRVDADTPESTYVALLYSELLGREGEDAGRAFWTAELETGRIDRADAFLAFAASDEAVRRIAPDTANGFWVVPDAAPEPPPESTVITLEIGNEPARRAIVSNTDPESEQPVVIMLHGLGSTPEFLQSFSGMDETAAEAGFAVAYPEALGRIWRFEDDDPFFDALIDRLVGEFGVDPAQIHVAGFSLGGFMAQYLGMTRADALAGIASVAGHLPAFAVPLTEPEAGLDVLLFHNRQDVIVPYDLPEGTPGDRVTDALETAAIWRDWNELETVEPVTGTVPRPGLEPGEALGPPAEVARYEGGQDGARLAVYTLDTPAFGGHFWPWEETGVDADREIAAAFDL